MIIQSHAGVLKIAMAVLTLCSVNRSVVLNVHSSLNIGRNGNLVGGIFRVKAVLRPAMLLYLEQKSVIPFKNLTFASTILFPWSDRRVLTEFCALCVSGS